MAQEMVAPEIGGRKMRDDLLTSDRRTGEIAVTGWPPGESGYLLQGISIWYTNIPNYIPIGA